EQARLASCTYEDTLPAGATTVVMVATEMTDVAEGVIVNSAVVRGGGDPVGDEDEARHRVPRSPGERAPVDRTPDGTVGGNGAGDGSPGGGLGNAGGPAAWLAPLALGLMLAGTALLRRRRRTTGQPAQRG